MIRRYRSLIAAVSTASAALALAPAQNAIAQRQVSYQSAIEQAQQKVQTFMAEKGVPGLSIAVGVDGRIVWSEGFGWANVEQRVPVTTLTRFRSGSVAKAVTSAAASVLWEQGKLDYDAPVQKYVPTFPDKGFRITPRQLAGHLAGIRYYPSGGEEFYSAKRYHDVVEGLEIFQNDSLLFPPGTKYFYTSYGTNLLGAAMQGAAGKPFPALMQELVFDPLGMRSTTVDEFDVITPYRTSYYERNNGAPSGFYQKKSSWGTGQGLGELLNAPFADNSNKWPGGGLITTPEDLVRFGSAHLKPGYLKAETLRMHFTPMTLTSGTSTTYAMNWDIGTDPEGRRVYSKGGSSVGGKSILFMYPDEGVVVAIQHNLTNPSYGSLPQEIAKLFAKAK